MAVAKRKTSKSRKRMRRSHHALKPMTLTTCRNCEKLITPHTVCKFCGFYKGKKILNIK